MCFSHSAHSFFVIALPPPPKKKKKRMLLRPALMLAVVAAAAAFGPTPTQLPGEDAKVRGEGRGKHWDPN